MKERPIIFKPEEVRAILDGRKTQTRRTVNKHRCSPHLVFLDDGSGWWPFESNDGKSAVMGDGCKYPLTCPYGQPGDRLWVREAFSPIYPQDPHYNNGNPIEYDYKATYQHGDRLGDDLGIKKIWMPAIHMPREASRITLEVTGVRVERLQDISDEDAIAEGIYPTATGLYPSAAKAEYQKLWESIHGHDSWAQNPWVWVIEFRRVEL